MAYLKFAPWILVGILAIALFGGREYYKLQIEKLTASLTTSQANEKIVDADLRSCKTAVGQQNTSIEGWKLAAQTSQRLVDEAGARADAARLSYERRIKTIQNQPLAQTCEAALQELRQFAKEDAQW